MNFLPRISILILISACSEKVENFLPETPSMVFSLDKTSKTLFKCFLMFQGEKL